MLKSTINKILLARRLYQISQENLNSTNETSLSIGVNLLQDSVESFLLAVSEHIDAGVGSNTNFDKYFDLINKKISPKELPFRFPLNSLNKLRVNSKHYGLSPSKTEADGLLITVRELFEEVSIQIFGKEFVTISLIDLLDDGEAREFLKIAEESFLEKKYEESLINCRKAIYVEIECEYDISFFKEESSEHGGLVIYGYKAPSYARNKKYIDENVKTTTDYIVYDYDRLDMDLMKSGMNRSDYWNVWRLTPEVYRKDKESEWIIKREFRKLDDEGIKERSEYVLDSTINLLIAKHSDLRRSKSPDYRKYNINLKRENVPVYEKADKNSKVFQIVPAGITKLFVDSTITGLNGRGTFWHVSHFDGGLSIFGYVDSEEVE